MPSLQNQKRSFYEFQKRILKSRFFALSLLLHLLLILLLGGVVLFNNAVQPSDFSAPAGQSFVETEKQAPKPPQQEQQSPKQPSYNVTTPTAAPTSPAIEAITTTAMTPTQFSIPNVASPVISPNISQHLQQSSAPKSAMHNGIPTNVAKGIAAFTRGWSKGDSGSGSDIRSRSFKFTAYIAKYKGGDWDSTITRMEDGKIVSGSLPNLLFFMKIFSHDRIDASPDAVPLDLSSDKIFATKPPFVFFTGHEDFKLTEKEVQNLRKYIQLGGCIWGDSSLPGRHSRFDIAFRREMKRVIPDVNVQFQPLPEASGIYQHTYFPSIKSAPPGMNYYHEPVYAMKQYGQIVVLYTPNDYGDMWQFGLTDKMKIDMSKDPITFAYLHMNKKMWDQRGIFFRDIDDASVAACYKFGTNVVLHLLTRWENQLRGVPTGF